MVAKDFFAATAKGSIGS